MVSLQRASEGGFAHQSEAEFAQLLDFYGVEWRYEAACFALVRDKAGNVSESYVPDFYLPQFNLFVELTTMKQRLVTKKNAKIRRFRSLYPDIPFKVFYRRDFRKLQMKMGARA